VKPETSFEYYDLENEFKTLRHGIIDIVRPTGPQSSARVESVAQRSEEHEWYDILHRCRHLNCKDPKDRIYAVLSLQGFASDLKPDYNLPVESVYIAVVKSMVRAGYLHQALASVNDRIVHEQRSRYNLPSWVPDFSASLPPFNRSLEDPYDGCFMDFSANDHILHCEVALVSIISEEVQALVDVKVCAGDDSMLCMIKGSKAEIVLRNGLHELSPVAARAGNYRFVRQHRLEAYFSMNGWEGAIIEAQKTLDKLFGEEPAFEKISLL
jgi:hypothetical protein